MKLRLACVVIGFLSLASLSVAQTSTQTASALPRLVRFGGTVKDLNGNPLTGVVGITFALYSEKTGGASLWLETQNVTTDSNGHYTVLLGSTKPDGLPAELFTSEQARWVGVQVSGQAEQPRVLLVSAPYALKAGDAETIGGLPPSAFVLAAPVAIAAPTDSPAATVTPLTATDVTTTGGTVGYLPTFNGADTIVDSVLFQSATSPFKIGINTATPATTLDVNGAGTIRGTLALPATGTATATAGSVSQGLNLVASSYNSTSATAVNQTFRWHAEPAANDTSAPTGTLNLLYGLGAAAPSETGLKISNKGLFTFATGQTFPGTGDGSVTSVATGLGLKGGPITKTGTLTIDTTVVPQLKAANTFAGNQTVSGNLSATGIVTGSSYQIGPYLFAFGSVTNFNAFLGFAGSTAATGTFNTASGVQALASNTTGFENTATGSAALSANTVGIFNTASGTGALSLDTTGSYNTASGAEAMVFNTTANYNTASGVWALYYNTTGPYNTATGYEALYGNTTANYNTATGAQALYNNSGEANLADGALALYSNTTGAGNTGVGADALYSNTTSNYVTCVGYSCSASDNISNATAIGARARVEQSNSLVLGGTGDHAVNVGIGTTKPSNILTVGRGAGHPVSDSWETYSSRRWKTNIQTLPNALAKVEKLRGVSYDLKANGKHEVGVIAEEVGAVVPEVVSYEENGKDARGVDYSRLTALLIEATKEQQALIREQQAQIARLARQVKTIKAALKASARSGPEVRTVKVEGAAARQ
ncbi:MAG: tail fiber domain-containing protein [Candidatus Sulfotelmatobacter sp.]